MISMIMLINMIQQPHSWMYIWKKKNSNSERYMCSSVHRNIIYNSQDMETSQVPINRRVT